MFLLFSLVIFLWLFFGFVCASFRSRKGHPSGWLHSGHVWTNAEPRGPNPMQGSYRQISWVVPFCPLGSTLAGTQHWDLDWRSKSTQFNVDQALSGRGPMHVLAIDSLGCYLNGVSAMKRLKVRFANPGTQCWIKLVSLNVTFLSCLCCTDDREGCR